MAASIRPYEPRDFDALYDVCVRTAASGEDLSDMIEDPMLPGHLFAGPYAVFEPGLAFVAEDDEGVGGYIVGTHDTVMFEARREAEWLPALRVRYPDGSGGEGLDSLLIALLHRPVPPDPGIVTEYPAHLHIDLLPRLQGEGLGRRSIDRFCAAVQGRGARGVHFGVNPANQRALGFYAHLGFERLRFDGVSVLFGRRFDDQLPPLRNEAAG